MPKQPRRVVPVCIQFEVELDEDGSINQWERRIKVWYKDLVKDVLPAYFKYKGTYIENLGIVRKNSIHITVN